MTISNEHFNYSPLIILSNCLELRSLNSCGMTRSLSIPRTDAFVWHYVKEVIKDSSLLKELFKKEVLETLSSDKATENISNELVKEKRLTKDRESIFDTLAEVQTEFLLNTNSDEDNGKLHQKKTDILTKKLEGLKKEILQVKENIKELRAERSWVDWVSKYGEQVSLQSDATPEEQRDYLHGLIDRIDVWKDDENSGHKIIIKFNIGIVEDSVIYNNLKNKSGGYEVKEGQQSVGGLIPKTPRGVKDDNYPLTDYSTVTDLAKFRG